MSLTSRLLGVRSASDRAAAAPANRDHGRAPHGGASSVWYSTPGQPQIPLWDGLTAIQNGYQASIYVMQPVRIIATALGSLPFRVGADPDKRNSFDVNAPLARLVGPPPHGPNPVTSPRNLWIWSIIQRLITGRMAWETVCAPGSDVPAALWPLVAPFVQPIPSQPGSASWFDGYAYQLPSGKIDYKAREVFYSWRPSQIDWRQPESALQSASMPTSLQVALDRYMWALAKNGLAAKKLVITPDFAEDDERRAWEEQFTSEFTGYDNGGKVLHGYYEDDPQANATGNRTPPIQVVDLAATPADAQVLEILKTVKDDMLRTWRVPMSWMGDSSQRTYENASQEAKNFWQGPVMEAAAEIADDVNMYLAPRFGDSNVGWWDFSSVEALKGTSIFGPIDPAAAFKAQLIVREDWRQDVGLPPLPDDAKFPTEQEALPAIDDSPGGTSKANFTRAADAPVAAGLVVKALDTGRVLMLQRHIDDPNHGGTWEFPGGKLEPGEHPLAAAVREWQEETGCALPAGKVAGSWTSPNGVYVGYVYLVPSEDVVPINCDPDDRHVLNPDDPDGDQAEVVAWWNPAHLPGMGALRPEAKTGTDWDLLAQAGTAEVRMADDVRSFDPAEARDPIGKWTAGHAGGKNSGSGVLPPSATAANIRDFQRREGLPITGRFDRATVAKMRELTTAKTGGRKARKTSKTAKTKAKALGRVKPVSPHAQGLPTTAHVHRHVLACGHRAGTCTGPGPCDTTPFGTGDNWVNKAGGLPPYIRAVAHAMHRKGDSESESIERAVGIIRNWAEGKGHVTAATRARAAKALAQWEALKAKAHTQRDATTLTEASSAGALLPQGSPQRLVTQMTQHMFVPSTANRRRCGVTGCGKPVTAAVHGLSGRRHAGHGHAPVQTGHDSATRRQTLSRVHGQADSIEPAMASAMSDLFTAQRKATLDRLNGRRGEKMLRAAAPPPPTEPPADGEQPAPLVDSAQVFDMAHWVAKTRAALEPTFAAVVSMTADRFGQQLGDHETASSLGGVRDALDQRLQRLAATVSQTTFDQISQVLHDGVAQRQTVAQMTDALGKVFDDAQANRAPMIARTESIGALNQAAATYADKTDRRLIAGHEWLSAHDTRVRHTHRTADGQVRAIGMPFEVGGAPMMFPHDPAAPASEVVNCRCTQAFLTPAEYARRTHAVPTTNVA